MAADFREILKERVLIFDGAMGTSIQDRNLTPDDLVAMFTKQARGLWRFPVILGGAALTRSYVEEDLRALYKGEVYYAGDAFDGLRFMEDIGSIKAAEAPELGDVLPRQKPKGPATASATRHARIWTIRPSFSSC